MRIKMPVWTIEEDKIFQENYIKGAKKVKELLPSRSLQAIYARGSLLKLVSKCKASKGKCKKCGVLLNIENCYESQFKRCDYICKTCSINESRENKKNNPERVKKWYRENQLHTNGKQYLVRKRPRPEDGLCELCKKKKCKSYHHFGDIETIEAGQFVLGVWVCKYCHPFMELYDKGYMQIYESLKEKVSNESQTHIIRD